MKLVFATNNAHKLREARQLAGDRIEILSLSDIGCHEEIPETSPDIEGNSLLKARYIRDKYGYDCFSDDTGLFVNALDGAPGVVSARYAGEGCTPADNVRKLIAEMKGKTDRRACFRTIVTLIQGEEAVQFEGKVEGKISETPEGEGGFGYDPVFVADESGISFATMSAEAKNAISHRGRAMRKLFDHLHAQSENRP